MRIPPELLSALPIDHCGVHVENEMDARQLIWLIDKIGVEKIRRSAQKYKYYPESKIFVSVLLKRFQLKVPAAIYAPVSRPIYRVYIVPSSRGAAFKVGYTGNLLDRLKRFVPHGCPLDDAFDISKGTYIQVSNKSEAIALEKKLKACCANLPIEDAYSMGYAPFGAGGHKEWFTSEALPLAKAELCTLGYTSRKISDALGWPDLRSNSETLGSC
ncbi:GIY-YIG nuclease family protein [Chromobacterium sp. TRC.1.1.SA]|uniref:GIY-YIG nuclease family protein n=1 Tax=Chromobacterium indicum TaxID=3110228 RepID=A0ABV0CGK9_9NEIS